MKQNRYLRCFDALLLLCAWLVVSPSAVAQAKVSPSAAGNASQQAPLATTQSVSLPEGTDGVEIIPLSSLEIGKATIGWGTTQADKSIDGNAITLGGIVYKSGVGTHSPSQIIVKLNGSVTRFYTKVGIDDEARSAYAADASRKTAVADYKAYLVGQGGETLTLSEGTITGGDTSYPTIDADVNGWKYLILETSNGADGVNASDHIDWALAYFEFQEQNSTRPCIVTASMPHSAYCVASTVS